MRYQASRRTRIENTRFAAHFPSLRTARDLNLGVHMFIQDVHLGIIPIGAGRGGRSNYSVNISGGSNEQKRVVTLLECLARRDRHSLEDLFSDALEAIVLRLAWHGRAAYEIVHDKGDASAYLLHDFTPQRLFGVFGYLLQIIPKQDRDLWGKTFTLAPSRDIWLISLPKLLGGSRGYRATLKKLGKFDTLGPRFWRNDLERSSVGTHFEFVKYVRESEIYTFRSTRRWGWNRRDFSTKNWTEFSQVFRSLTFKWAKAVVRQHVISEIKKLLVRLEIDADLHVSGLICPHEILRIRREMAKGNIAFAEALEAASA